MSWPMQNPSQWNQGMALAPDMSMGSYTPEQWAAMQQQNWQQWTQWQQQYAQWQSQYGEKYAEQIQAIQAMGGIPPLPPANTAPLPAPPPPEKPPPPPHENNQPLYGHIASQPGPVPAPVANQSSNPIMNSGNSISLNTHPQAGNSNWSSVPEPNLSIVNAEALKKLAEEERLFSIQFQKWEEEIEKWKKDNVNHPDKQAYREYEEKFETCRAQLMERRQQMNKKKARLLGTAPPPPPPNPVTTTAPTVVNTVATPLLSNPINNTYKPQQSFGNNSTQNDLTQNINQPQKYGNNTTQNYSDQSHQYQQYNMPQNTYNRLNNINTETQEKYDTYHSKDSFSGPTNPSFLLASESTKKGIPGLDLVPDADKSYGANKSQDVIDITGENPNSSIVSQGPDYSTISQGINNILGDEKIMNMLSMVRGQVGQDVKNNTPAIHSGNSVSNQNNPHYDQGYRNQNYNNQQNTNRPPNTLYNPGGNYLVHQNQDALLYTPPQKMMVEDRPDGMVQEQYNDYDRNVQYGVPPPGRPNMPGPRPLMRPLLHNMPNQQNLSDYTRAPPGSGQQIVRDYPRGPPGPPGPAQQNPSDYSRGPPGPAQQNANDYSRGPPGLGQQNASDYSRGPPVPAQQNAGDYSRGPAGPAQQNASDYSRGPPGPAQQNANDYVRGPLGPAQQNSSDYSRGPLGLDHQNVNDYTRVPQGLLGTPGLLERKPLSENNINPIASQPARPKWAEEPMFSPSLIVEYEHKPLRLKARDFIEPVHMFDYNHKSKDEDLKKKDFEKEVDDLFVRVPRRSEKELDHGGDRYNRDYYSRDFERRAPRIDLRDDVRPRAPPRDDYDDRRRLDDDRRRQDESRRRPEDDRRRLDTKYDDRRRDDRDKYSRRDDIYRNRDRDTQRDRNRETKREDTRHHTRNQDTESRKRGLSRESDLSDSYSKRSREQDVTAIKLEASSHVVMIDDLLEPPGREMRPEKIVIILRGPPGSGKSYIAKLIRDKEAEQGGTVRIMSIDDYFMQEGEVEEQDPTTGKTIKKPTLKYEYDESSEETYLNSLKKAFKKSLTDGYFTFIIYDAVNDTLKSYADIWNASRQNDFQVYICTMELDPQICYKRNIHNRKLHDIETISARFYATPSHHIQLDATTLLQSGAITEVHMEDADDEVIMEDAQEHEVESVFTSKWEKMDDAAQLARLDGTSKPLRSSHLSMEDYLQLDDWKPTTAKPGKKTVRWADIEERRQQEKMRAIGFVVGQTDWNRMTDPTMGSSALTQTKYIERVKRN